MAEVRTFKARHENWTKGGPVFSDMEASEIEALEDRAAATVADPGPMGMWALATGSWIFGAVVAAFPIASLTSTAPMLFSFAGIALFIAGLYAYSRASVLAATAFCSFGSLYFATGLFFGLISLGAIPGTGNTLIIYGFLLESFAFIALALGLAAMKTNLIMVGTMLTLWIGYALIGVPFLADALGQGGWGIVQSIGGWFLCASAAFAYYLGAALVVNSVWSRTVLPIGGHAV